MRLARILSAVLLTCPFLALGVERVGEDSSSPFGIGSCHVNNRTAQDNARWVPQMESIGLRHYRAAQTLWGAVEPEEGRWRWDVLDAQMAYLKEHRLRFGGILLGNPRWNTLDKPGSLPVHNLAGWSRYVSAVVTHAQGSIKD